MPYPLAASFRIAVVVVFALSSLALAQDKDSQNVQVEIAPATNPWTSLKLNNDPGNFQFVVVSDRTGGHRAGVFEDAMHKINLLQPEFVMSVGDLIEGYSHDEPTVDQMWKEFRSFTAMLKMPFFYVPGNHDMANAMETRKWKENFGRDYYHFVYRDVLFLCLNSEDNNKPSIGDAQRQYIKKALDENKNVRWTLVFLHRPLWRVADVQAKTAAQEKPNGWAEVESMLRTNDRQFTVFAGHEHQYLKTERNDRNFIVMATTGAGSALRGTSFGEFDEVAWVTMTNDGPVMANLLLNGIWDQNVTTDTSKARVDKLATSAHVSAKPLLPADATFAGGVIPVKITNDADLPLQVSARFRPHPDLLPDPFALEMTIAPNSVEEVQLKLSTKTNKVSAADIAPLILDETLTYTPTDLPKLQIRRTLPVAIDQSRPIARVDGKVVIDGKLDEWKSLPNVCSTPMEITGDESSWEGPTDASFRFATAYDDDFVYIAIESIDERVLPMESADRRSFEDGIAVRLDARPAKSRPAGMGKRDENDKFLYLSGSPGDTADKTFFRQAEMKALPEGTKFVCVKAEKGFNTEIAIPTKYLNAEQKEAWKDFRLAVFQTDRDDEEGSHAQIHWRPDWRSSETFVGSGTFKKK